MLPNTILADFQQGLSNVIEKVNVDREGQRKARICLGEAASW